MGDRKNRVMTAFCVRCHPNMDILQLLADAKVKCGDGVLEGIGFEQAFDPPTRGVKTVGTGVLYVDVHLEL